MPKIVIDVKQYQTLVEKLALKVAAQLPGLNLIVGIIRGGFYPADILSRALEIDWAYLYVQSYGHGQTPGEIRLGRELIGSKPERGQTVLIVDDLTDSGQTLEKTLEWFQVHFRDYELKVKTAVVWKKASSSFEPDIYAEDIPFVAGTQECPWIIQAHEFEAERIQQQVEKINVRSQK